MATAASWARVCCEVTTTKAAVTSRTFIDRAIGHLRVISPFPIRERQDRRHVSREVSYQADALSYLQFPFHRVLAGISRGRVTRSVGKSANTSDEKWREAGSVQRYSLSGERKRVLFQGFGTTSSFVIGWTSHTVARQMSLPPGFV